MVLVFFLSITLYNRGWSQPGPDQDNGPSVGNGGSTTNDDPVDPGDPGQDPDLPIDTNILVLVAAGVGYGLKKRYDIKQAFKRKKDSLNLSSGN